MDPKMTYARSTAISPEHYKLVAALENATSSGQTESILLRQIDQIKLRWQSSTASSKAAAHDLIIILYALSQRPENTYQPDDGTDPWSAEFALAGAVKLAGGAAKLTERAIGYRACDELFTEAPHSLKLLLINSIRSDLYAHTGSPDAELRWTLGLRAASSGRLGCAELAPAIADRVLDLFTQSNSRIRRLALAALLQLIALSPPDDSDSPSSLANSTRTIIQKALTPPPPPPLSTATRSHSDRSISRLHPPPPGPTASLSESDPGALLALVRACAPNSTLYPVAPRPQTIRLLLGVLRRVIDGEWAGERVREYHGLGCGWLAAGILDTLAALLAATDEHTIDKSLQVEVAHSVLAYAGTILDKVDLGHALLLSSCQALQTIPSELLKPAQLGPPYADTLRDLLTAIKSDLHGKDINWRVGATRCLVLLPAEVWAGAEDEREPTMGEREWERIMRGLEAKDSALRKETLCLLQHVDPALAAQHVARLEASLKALGDPPPAGSHAPPASKAAVAAVINLVLEASNVVDCSVEDWAKRVIALVGIVGKAESVVGELVMGTLDRYAIADAQDQAKFGEALLKEGGWKKDLSLALLVAATAGGGASSLGQRREAALALAGWLADASASAGREAGEQLAEPFLLSILRLLSSFEDSEEEDQDEEAHLAGGPAEEEEDNSPFSSQIQSRPAPPSATSTSKHSAFLAKLDKLIDTASRASSLATAPLFALYTRCRTEELAQKALREAGAERKAETLPGFFEALQRRLRASVPAPSAARATYRDRASSTSSSSVGSPQREKTQRLEKPLRYEAYDAGAGREDEERERERERRREKRALERERTERGGRGGLAESVLAPGALVGLAVEGDGEESSEEEGEERRGGIDLLGPASPTDPFAQH